MRRDGRAPAALPARAAEADLTISSAPAYAVPVGVERRGSHWAAERVREAIAEGIYAAGSRLPAERQLAEGLAVARGTVREALRMLGEDGLVERRIGIGTFVIGSAAAGQEDVAEITSPLELMEVRDALEPQIVRLVVLNATPRDFMVLREALDQLERSGADRQRFSDWDQRFHQAMAEATHNPLMVHLYRSINHARSHAQWQAIKEKVLTKDRIAAYNREHRALFEAVLARDLETALAVVGGHLQSARNDLMKR